MSQEEFISESMKIHGSSRYDYSCVLFKNMKEKITLKCNVCGHVFEQMPYAHLQGQGCRKCFENNIGQMLASNADDFITKAKEVHGNRYDYSNVEYINNQTKVEIICRKHGKFHQTPHNHISGQGCPKCKESKLERTVEKILVENNVVFEKQYKEIDNRMRMDFYLSEYSMVIECQGIQHFEPTKFNTINADKAFDKFIVNLKRDKRKYDKCIENGVEIIYYTNLDVEEYDIFNNEVYNGIYNKGNFFNNENEMIEYIKNKPF